MNTRPVLKPLSSGIINPTMMRRGSITRWDTQRSYTERLGTSVMPLIVSASNGTLKPPKRFALESVCSMKQVIPNQTPTWLMLLLNPTEDSLTLTSEESLMILNLLMSLVSLHMT